MTIGCHGKPKSLVGITESGGWLSRDLAGTDPVTVTQPQLDHVGRIQLGFLAFPEDPFNDGERQIEPSTVGRAKPD